VHLFVWDLSLRAFAVSRLKLDYVLAGGCQNTGLRTEYYDILNLKVMEKTYQLRPENDPSSLLKGCAGQARRPVFAFRGFASASHSGCKTTYHL
jgi:hypothetical protein